uniref:Uncharacterized protein n=1 Tax=Amphimedon queenslandica TaxID=400682 RepID=A0A1X7SLM4_AMPQE
MKRWQLQYQCRTAFQRRDRKEAVRLLRLQDPKLLYLKEPVLLYHSISNGWLDVTRDLITIYRFNLSRYNNNQSCLYTAAKGNHVDIVEYLIKECGCDPMIGTTTRYSSVPVLHYVAREGLLDVLKCMVMNINGHIMDEQYRDINGWTVLHRAVKHIDVVKYLINECNYDTMIPDKDGVPFLHYLASEGLLDVLKCMVKNINGHIMDEQYRDTNGWTVLHRAVKHIDVVKYLINECNCDIMTRDRFGDTFLHVAARKKLVDVLKYVINTHQYNSGQTGYIDVVKYLINECNCDIMIPDKNASEGLLDVLKCMVKNINVHIMDEQYHDTNGWTALHYAVKHIDVVKYLINECNCDIMIPDKNASKGLLDVLKCMVMNINGHIMDEQYHDTNGWTALHYAVKHINVVKYLINECNCDIMIPDKNASKGLLDVLKCM